MRASSSPVLEGPPREGGRAPLASPAVALLSQAATRGPWSARAAACSGAAAVGRLDERRQRCAQPKWPAGGCVRGTRQTHSGPSSVRPSCGHHPASSRFSASADALQAGLPVITSGCLQGHGWPQGITGWGGDQMMEDACVPRLASAPACKAHHWWRCTPLHLRGCAPASCDQFPIHLLNVCGGPACGRTVAAMHSRAMHAPSRRHEQMRRQPVLYPGGPQSQQLMDARRASERSRLAGQAAASLASSRVGGGGLQGKGREAAGRPRPPQVLQAGQRRVARLAPEPLPWTIRAFGGLCRAS